LRAAGCQALGLRDVVAEQPLRIRTVLGDADVLRQVGADEAYLDESHRRRQRQAQRAERQNQRNGAQRSGGNAHTARPLARPQLQGDCDSRRQ